MFWAEEGTFYSQGLKLLREGAWWILVSAVLDHSAKSRQGIELTQSDGKPPKGSGLARGEINLAALWETALEVMRREPR